MGHYNLKEKVLSPTTVVMGGKTSRLMSAKNNEVSTVRRVFIEAHGQIGLRQERNAVVHGPALSGHAETLRSGEGEDYKEGSLMVPKLCPAQTLSEPKHITVVRGIS